MKFFLTIILLTTLTLRGRADDVSAQAFTPNEFKALYELMVQYKYGRADNCPTVIKYNARPVSEGDDLLIPHSDMRIGDDGLRNCTDPGIQRVTLAQNLRGSRLADFIDSIDGNLDKRTVFDGLRSELAGKRYYVSVSDSARVCGDHRWFERGETFFYFDESESIRLTVVAKVTGGEPKFLSLPLVGNIRYMIAVTAGTSCIYRVQSDVATVILGSARPSDSPSSTPRPSASQTPSVSASQVPVPSSTPSVTPSQSVSTSTSPSVGASVSPSVSVSQATSPAPSMSSTSSPLVSSSPSSSVSSSPIPSVSSSSSASVSSSPSLLASSSSSPVVSSSSSPAVSSSSLPSASSSSSPAVSSSSSPAVSSSSSPAVSSSSSPAVAPTSSPEVSSSSSPSESSSLSPSASASSSPAVSSSSSPSVSPSSSPSESSSSSPSGSSSSSPSESSSSSPSESSSLSPSSTASATPTPIPSASTSRGPSSMPSMTPTRSSSPKPSITPTRTSSPRPSTTPTRSATPQPSSTSTLTMTPSRPPTRTPIATSTPTNTVTPQASLTPEQSLLPTRTPIAVPTTVVSPFPPPSSTSSASPGSNIALLGSATPSMTPGALTAPLGSATPSISHSPSPSDLVLGIEPGNQVGNPDRNSSSFDGTSTCFPASATVQTRNGVIRMDELKIGDFVWSGIEFTRVFMFTHQNDYTHTRFIRLTTSSNSITLTSGHYLYVNGGLTPAREVRIGDMLNAGRVVKKEIVFERGLYNPQTENGDIAVDGVMSSCYTDAVLPVTGHALLSPIRLVKDLIPEIVGMLGRRIESFVDG